MKKVIFSLVLTLGVFVSMQAQTLYVQIVNNTPDTWKYGVVDGNGNVPTPAMGAIGGGGGYSGTISNFIFDLDWTVLNMTNGCANANTITGAMGNTTALLFCSVAPPPPYPSITYSCTLIGSGPDYLLRVALN